MFDKQLCCITKSVQGCWDYWPPLAPVKTRNPRVWRIRHRLSISKLWRLPLWLFLVTQNLIHSQTYRRTGSPGQLFRCCDYCERPTPSSGFRSSETLYHWRCYLKCMWQISGLPSPLGSPACRYWFRSMSAEWASMGEEDPDLAGGSMANAPSNVGMGRGFCPRHKGRTRSSYSSVEWWGMWWQEGNV